MKRHGFSIAVIAALLAGAAVAEPNETDLSGFSGVYEGTSSQTVRSSDEARTVSGDGTVFFRTRQQGLGAVLRWVGTIPEALFALSPRLRQRFKFDKGGKARIRPVIPLYLANDEAGSKFTAKPRVIRLERNFRSAVSSSRLRVKTIIRVQDLANGKRLKLLTRVTNPDASDLLIYRFEGTTEATANE